MLLPMAEAAREGWIFQVRYSGFGFPTLAEVLLLLLNLPLPLKFVSQKCMHEILSFKVYNSMNLTKYTYSHVCTS